MQLRQGDVMLRPTRRRRTATQPIVDQGRTILAYGEITGHVHEVVTDTPVGDPDPVPPQQLFEEPDGTRLLCVQRPCALVHDEHAPLALSAGVTYEVIQQVEWRLDDIRAVAD